MLIWFLLLQLIYAYIPSWFPLYLSIAIFNLQLFTVPVSTRTCLRVEKVQSCHPALLNLGVWQSVLSSSMLQKLSSHSPSHYLCQFVVLTEMVFGLCGLLWCTCQPAFLAERLLRVPVLSFVLVLNCLHFKYNLRWIDTNSIFEDSKYFKDYSGPHSFLATWKCLSVILPYLGCMRQHCRNHFLLCHCM